MTNLFNMNLLEELSMTVFKENIHIWLNKYPSKVQINVVFGYMEQVKYMFSQVNV